MSRIQVALFSDFRAAEVVQQALVRGGVSAEIHAEVGLAKLWYVPRGGAGVRVEVPAREAARATELLRQWDAYLLAGAIRCPECKSLRVQFPQLTQKSLFTNLLLGLAAELRLVERQYYCEDCHYMWAKPRAKPPRLRAHLAPNYFLEEPQRPPDHPIRQP